MNRLFKGKYILGSSSFSTYPSTCNKNLIILGSNTQLRKEYLLIPIIYVLSIYYLPGIIYNHFIGIISFAFPIKISSYYLQFLISF